MSYRKYFTLSFDDGLEQDKKFIELMKKYSIKGTFNLNGGLLGVKGSVGRVGNIAFKNCEEGAKQSRFLKYNELNRIPKDEIRQVYEGFEVASHAYLHESLGRIPVDKMKKSIDLDVETLFDIMGYQIRGHAYARGSTSKVVDSYLKEKGILYGRGVFFSNSFQFPENPFNFRPTCSHASKKVFELLNKFISAQPKQDDMLFYMWGHAYEFDFGSELCSWSRIEKIFQTIAGHEDIIYCTNVQAFEQHYTLTDNWR